MQISKQPITREQVDGFGNADMVKMTPLKVKLSIRRKGEGDLNDLERDKFGAIRLV